MIRKGVSLEVAMKYGFEYMKKSAKNEIPLYSKIKHGRKEYKKFKKKGLKEYTKDKLTPSWLKKVNKLIEGFLNPNEDELKKPTRRQRIMKDLEETLPWYLKPYKKNFANVAVYIELMNEKENKRAFRTAKETSKDKTNDENDFFDRSAKKEKEFQKQRTKEANDLNNTINKMKKSKQKAREEMSSLIEEIFVDSSIDTSSKAEIYGNFSQRNADFKAMFIEFINDMLTMTWVSTTKKIRAIELVMEMKYGGFESVCIFVVKSPTTGNFSVAPLKYDLINKTLEIVIRSGNKKGLYRYSYKINSLDVIQKAMATNDYGKNFYWRYTPPSNVKNMPKYKGRYKDNTKKYRI